MADFVAMNAIVIVELQMWPSIISKAKEGGLDVIESYVFWNYHEPVRGQVLCSSSPISLPMINYVYLFDASLIKMIIVDTKR